MIELINFVRQWYCDYHDIFEVFGFLVLILIGLFKKRVRVVDTIREVIFENLPHFINLVERPGDGPAKMEEVVQLMIAFLCKLYPGIQINQYESFIRKSIKGYLSTPQDKKRK